MQNPKIPSNEEERLKELASFQIVGIEEDQDFDFITEMAAKICGTKISLISLVTADKQWFLSHHGLEVKETSRDFSFCAHAIHTPNQPFVVEDARQDERFSGNPLTEDDPNVIFYAGIPLVSQNGLPLGSLCVIDDVPKKLTADQLNQLQRLANQTIKLFELRRSQNEMTALNLELQKNIEFFKETEQANSIGSWELDIKSGQTKWAETVYRIHEVDLDFDHNKHNGIEFYHPDYRKIIIDALTDCMELGKRFDVTCILITAKGNQRWVRSTGKKLGEKIIGSFQDITEIKQNELKFKGIFNLTFSFIMFLDDKGVLLDANDTAINMAGLKHSDVIGRYYWDCYWWQISSKTRQELKTNFEKVLLGETIIHEVEVWVADQTPITILFSMKPIFDDGGKVIFVISEGRPVQDIVEVRNRYRAVLEGTQAGTFEWNIDTDEVFINDRFAELLGYTVEELQPITFDKWLNNAMPEDLLKAQDVIKKCFKKEKMFFELEMRMKHKSGSWIWVNVRGKIFEWSAEGKALKMYGTLIEISGRKNIELKLLEERSLLRTIIDSSPDAIYVKDLEGHKLIANKADVELCGARTEEEVLGKTDDEIYPPEVSIGTSQAEERVLFYGESLLNEEGVLTDKNGNEIWLLTSKFPIYDQNAKVRGLVGMGRNITNRRNAEQELIYNKSLLETLYVLSPIGIALNDYETGKFLDGNQKLLEPTGYTKEEFMALSYWDVTPKEYEPLEIVALNQMQSKGSFDLFEKEYIRKDGSRYPVALQGVVVEDTKGKKLIWSFIRDISEEKESKRKLQEALARLKAILDASTQVSIIATDKNGVISLFNSGAEKLTGYKAEELIGKYTPQVIHLDSEVLKEGEELSEQEGRLISGFDVFIHHAVKGKFNTK
ncbi:hypothetical protein GCM10026987_15140 [Belliella aquatica]|uniref:PAS domain S-box protein n=1 Tax=Belliella aquatica TaxID=1323734 RepID=A0ABQ1LRA6_9BACT|nr:hypothetical protein GCM10010993_02600 [Belliella aquatica]